MRMMAMAMAISTAGAGLAQPAPYQGDRTVAIAQPAQPLGEALIAAARAHDATIVIAPPQVAGRIAPALKGRYTLAKTFAMLLAGSGLRVVRDGGTLKLVVDTGNFAAGARRLSTIRVAGIEDAGTAAGYGAVAVPTRSANGGSDVLATEGTGSYAAPGTRLSGNVAMSIHDTPRSVTVLTLQRIEDQRLDTLNDVLAATPGLTLKQDNSLEYSITSRGFYFNNYQIDGGAPFVTFVTLAGRPQRPLFDMSEFDNVSLVRGGDALISGFGDPGGVINLQRKVPLDHRQIAAEAILGSFGKRRVSLDVSTPLSADGRLKIRAVGTRDQNGFFYDRAYQKTDIGFINVSFDPDARTGFNIGGSYRRQRALPWTQGLPRYADGSELDLPRSTCFCFDDNLLTQRTWEGFVQGRRSFGKDWKLTVRMQVDDQHNADHYTLVSALVGIKRNTGDYAFLYGSDSRAAATNLGADASLDGAFTLFGRKQTFTAGVQYAYSNVYRTRQAALRYPRYDAADGGYYDVFNFDPAGNRPVEEDIDVPVFAATQHNGSVFAQLRLNPLAGIWLTVSDRYEWYRSLYSSVDYLGDRYASRERHAKWQKPAFSARYDFSTALNAFTSISFIDSVELGQFLTKELKRLPPQKGRNIEGGVRYASSGGRLNASLIAFYVRRTGGQAVDPGAEPPDGVPIYASCCHIAGTSAHNRGLEFETSGAMTPRWQIGGGYTFTVSQYRTTIDPVSGETVRGASSSSAPRHLAKLWTSYALPGPFHRLMIGGGAQLRSAISSDGVFYPDPPETLTFGDSNVIVALGGVNRRYTAKGGAVIDLFGRYALTDTTSVQANVTNVFDRRYYDTIDSVSSGNWLGRPRAIEVRLATRF